MKIPKQFSTLFLLVALLSCNGGNIKYPYAIKNFSSELQLHLNKMMNEGIVIGGDSVFRRLATDDDLERLGESEHPILRATAFREMLNRKSFDHFKVVMGHLDDTALVFIDAGEFGIWDRTVSDDILQEAEWDTQASKDSTVSEVLTKHNYLRSAYIILHHLEPQEKFYPFIKDMATRTRRLDYYQEHELGFRDIEYALHGLAKFKRKEDIPIIKQKLMRHAWELSDQSFWLMTRFPDSSYFDVLQKYHRLQFYKFSGNRPYGFSGVVADRAAPEDFIRALVAQQSNRSAKLLDTMLTYLPKNKCMPDKDGIMDALVMAIWDQPCTAYAGLRQKIKSRAQKLLAWRVEIPSELYTEKLMDTTQKVFRW